MVRVRMVLGGFYYGSGHDYNCGLKYIFVWGVKQHISIAEVSAGEEYIMRVGGVGGGGYKSMGLFNLLVKLNCTDK